MEKEKIIKDAIYGFVRVPKICQQFIDTPEFQRLRRIKQLGLAHYVYPGAVHTRFEHSLGVMHLAGKVADNLSEHISKREKLLLQLAALLHDVGHVAFSHLIDYILEEQKVDPKLAHHENRSIQILHRINNRINVLSASEVNIISKMILGDTTDTEKTFLFEIISNKKYGLDIDRLDYLQRDLYHTGSPCFQADYVIECIRVKDNRLAVLKKAQPEIRMMYESRKRLLMLICRHKTVMKVEKLIREAIKITNMTGDWFVDNWLMLDDCRAQCMLEDQAFEIMNRIYTRDWPEIGPSLRLQYVQYINPDDINKQISKVLWY